MPSVMAIFSWKSVKRWWIEIEIDENDWWLEITSGWMQWWLVVRLECQVQFICFFEIHWNVLIWNVGTSGIDFNLFGQIRLFTLL